MKPTVTVSESVESPGTWIVVYVSAIGWTSRAAFSGDYAHLMAENYAHWLRSDEDEDP